MATAVGEHVGGVGQQGQRSGHEGGDRLHHHEGDGERERDPEAPDVAGGGAAQGVAVVVPTVVMRVAHPRILAARGVPPAPSGHNENHAQL